MTATQAAAPARRRVYYLSGFDPRGPRFYHQLLRDQARLQSATDGAVYEVGPRHGQDPLCSTWQVTAQDSQGRVDTDFVFLRWDDLIRRHWPESIPAMFRGMVGFYRLGLADGSLARTWGCARRMFWTLLTPLIFAMMAVVAALVMGWGMVELLGMAGPAMVPLHWLAGLATACGTIWLAHRAARQWKLDWLVRILLFARRWARQPPPELDIRWRALAERMHQDDARAPVDEVVLIGHSVGAIAAMPVVAHWLASPSRHPSSQLSLLTLGQVIPLLSFMEGPHGLREQIGRIATSTLPWLDYTAPADPLCHALMDPVTSAGWPARPSSLMRVRSARLDKMFAPHDYQRLRKDAFRLHFQYLMATSLPVKNDFFQLIAGRLTMEERLRAS